MEPTARLYHCARCHAQVIICSQCDRGNIYCHSGCADIARKKSLQESGKKYQSTSHGKHNHAARQHRYRLRNLEKVTHQGSINSLDDSCSSVSGEKKHSHEDEEKIALCCCFCKKPVLDFLRNDYLRCQQRNKLNQYKIGSTNTT